MLTTRKMKITLVISIALALLITLIAPSTAMANSTQFSYGYCTRYAAEQFDSIVPAPGVTWNNNAEGWGDSAASAGWIVTQNVKAPEVGAIVVWRGGLGHVAIVRSYSPTGIYIAEMNAGTALPGFSDKTSPNYGKTTMWNKVSCTTLTWDKVTSRTATLSFKCYILPRRSVPPTYPGNITAVAISRSQIRLQWTNPPYASGIIIERLGAFGIWSQIGKVNITLNTCTPTSSYLDNFLSPNRTYTYRVKAFNNLVGYPVTISAKTLP